MALTILNIICIFYYNIPIHNQCNDGATDYKWQPNRFYSRATEGFAVGKINNDGYTNMFDYDKNSNIDILLMGSSHMEAFNVAMDESTASRLNFYFNMNRVYNIGISSHTLLNCINNIDKAINKYNPKYIILETGTITFSNDDLQNLISNQYKKIPSNSNGIIGLLQKNQVLRLLYKQYRGFKSKKSEDLEDVNNDFNYSYEYEKNTLNQKLLQEVIKKVKKIISKNEIKLIIMYHPSTTLANDGSLILSSEHENIEGFKEICEQNDILFLDMSDKFREEYEKNYILPYGFNNTSVGTGHLNKYGHEM